MNTIRILTALILSVFTMTAYAIQVNVQSSSGDVSALGFSVNGKNHGAAGKFYRGKDMPTGSYSFGVRVKGVFGTDVSCPVKGMHSVNLYQDTTAVLYYNGNTCVARLSQSL